MGYRCYSHIGGCNAAVQALVLAALYSIGAHGIMTLNDFKAIKGDREMGINSLPVLLGPERAAQVASTIMVAPRVVVIALLLSWGQSIEASVVALLLIGQLMMMRRFLRAPIAEAIWYSGFGVPLFVLRMMASAFAVRIFAVT